MKISSQRKREREIWITNTGVFEVRLTTVISKTNLMKAKLFECQNSWNTKIFSEEDNDIRMITPREK